MTEGGAPEPGSGEASAAPRRRRGRGLKLAGGTLLLLCAAGLGAFYLWLGWITISPGEEAIVLRLGRYDRTLRAGPHIYFPGLETLERERVTNRRMEFGYSTRAPDASPLETPETDAPRLVYEDDPTEQRMITGDANLVDVEFVLEYDITDLRSFRLSVEDATGILRDVARAAVREAVAQRTVDATLRSARSAIELDAEERMAEMLDAFTGREAGGGAALGITVVSLRLQDVYPPEPVREAFRDVTSALQDKERLQLAAQTYRDEVVPRARGEAASLIAAAQGYRDSKLLEAEGEASRFSALLEEYRKAPEVTRSRLYIETLEAVLPEVEKIIMHGGTGDRMLPYLPLGRRREP